MSRSAPVSTAPGSTGTAALRPFWWPLARLGEGLEALARAGGLSGAVLGRALLEGRFGLSEALAC